MKTIINYIDEAKHSFRIKSHLKKQTGPKELDIEELEEICKTNDFLITIAVSVKYISNIHTEAVDLYLLRYGDDTIGKDFGQPTYDMFKQGYQQLISGWNSAKNVNKETRNVIDEFLEKTGIKEIKDKDQIYVEFTKTSIPDPKSFYDKEVLRKVYDISK